MIHSTAIIESDCNIGFNVSIGPYSIIRKNVVIGDNCKIGAHVEIGKYTVIGKYNQIYKGAFIGSDPQDISYDSIKNIKHFPSLIIGDYNIFREYVSVHYGTKRVTKIDNNNYFMANSHIAHDCELGSGIVMANYAALGGWVKVADKVFISAHSSVHQYARIGTLSMIGGLCRVSQDVIPFVMVADKNAKLCGLNIFGLKRDGFDNDKLLELKKVYKLMFRCNDISLSRAVSDIKKQLSQGFYKNAKKEIIKLLDFIECNYNNYDSNCSNRGILSKSFMN